MSERESLTTMLHLATDRVDDPRLERQALDIGRRRRTRRRGLVAGVLAAGVTAAVIVVVHVTGGTSAGPPPVTHTPSPSADARVWPQWDPRDADELPVASSRIAPALPTVIQPPDSSPSLADHPVAAAIAATVRRGLVQVLGVNGEWRTVSVPGSMESPRANLSPAGTRLVVKSYGADAVGPTVYDLGTGSSRVLPTPPDFRPFEPYWTFVDEHTLLLRNGQRGWFVDARTGAATSAPATISRNRTGAVDPRGDVLVAADWGSPRVLFDYDGSTVRRVSMHLTGRLTSVAANDHAIAGTTYDDRPLSIVVADRATLTPTTWLPVGDHEGNYSPGLHTLALSDDDRVVLFRVGMVGKSVGVRVVAWDTRTGQLSLVSRTNASIQVDFATGLLLGTG